MKKIITLLLITSPLLCFSQKKDSIQLTPLQQEKLIAIDKELVELENKKNALIQKQKDLLEIIFDNKGIVLDRVKSLKYENGKFIFELN